MSVLEDLNLVRASPLAGSDESPALFSWPQEGHRTPAADAIPRVVGDELSESGPCATGAADQASLLSLHQQDLESLWLNCTSSREDLC